MLANTVRQPQELKKQFVMQLKTVGIKVTKEKLIPLLGAAPDSLKGKPTNSEFIALIADKLKIKNRYAFESR